MKRYCVYSIRNRASGKRYVGQSENYKRRWKEHKSGRGCAPLIARALAKYGERAFDWTVLATTNSKDKANDLEIHYIARLKCLAPLGYNLRPGGDLGTRHPHTTAKIVAKLRGRKFNAAFKEKCRARQLGVRPSSATIEKRRASAVRVAMVRKSLPKTYHARGRAIAKYHINGSYIHTYISIAAVAGDNVSLAATISGVCRGVNAVAGGFRWAPTHGVPVGRLPPLLQKQQGARKVLQIRNGRVVQPFSSIAEAAREINVKASGISGVLSGRTRTAGGFTWQYDDGSVVRETRARKPHPHRVLGKYTLAGAYIDTFSNADAAQGNKTHAVRIQAVANGHRRSACGFRWAWTHGVPVGSLPPL